MFNGVLGFSEIESVSWQQKEQMKQESFHNSPKSCKITRFGAEAAYVALIQFWPVKVYISNFFLCHKAWILNVKFKNIIPIL